MPRMSGRGKSGADIDFVPGTRAFAFVLPMAALLQVRPDDSNRNLQRAHDSTCSP